MSHVAVKKTVQGEPLITSLDAVRRAAERMGMVCTARSTYRWYGSYQGDWPRPAGTEVSELGKNAVLVLSVSPEKERELERKYGRPYELAVVADANNPGAYTLMYDFWNRGYGLNDVIGDPKIAADGSLEVCAPKFMMHYRLAVDEMAAAAAGDAIEFEEQPDGSWLSYTVANAARVEA